VLSTNGLIKTLAYPFIIRDQNSDEAKEENDIAVWAIQITYAINPHSFIDKSAKIAFWDQDIGQWSQDGIRDIEIEPGNIKFNRYWKSKV
jgi:hypothetical protein